MISRSHRFHGYGSLKYVYRAGSTVRGPLFAVKSVSNDKRASYRVSVVVSRKVNKSAVARNRISRRLYAAVRLLQDDIVLPHDIVITIFSSDVLQTSSDQLRQQLKNQMASAGVVVKRVQR